MEVIQMWNRSEGEERADEKVPPRSVRAANREQGRMSLSYLVGGEQGNKGVEGDVGRSGVQLWNLRTLEEPAGQGFGGVATGEVESPQPAPAAKGSRQEEASASSAGQPTSAEANARATGTTGQHKCAHCGQICKFKSEMLYHDYIHGINKDLTVCHECGLAFSKMFTYRSHIKCVHDKEKRYKCEECGKGFYFKKDLPKHRLAVHERVKSFKCTVCGTSFAKREHLMRHLKSVHAGGPVNDAAG